MSDLQRKDDSLLAQHIQEERDKFDAILIRLTELEKNSREMNLVWTQAMGALRFIKILSYLAAAGAAVYTFITTNITIVPK